MCRWKASSPPSGSPCVEAAFAAGVPDAVMVDDLAEQLGVGLVRGVDAEAVEQLRPEDGRRLGAPADQTRVVRAPDLAAMFGEGRELEVEQVSPKGNHSVGRGSVPQTLQSQKRRSTDVASTARAMAPATASCAGWTSRGDGPVTTSTPSRWSGSACASTCAPSCRSSCSATLMSSGGTSSGVSPETRQERTTVVAALAVGAAAERHRVHEHLVPGARERDVQRSHAQELVVGVGAIASSRMTPR